MHRISKPQVRSVKNIYTLETNLLIWPNAIEQKLILNSTFLFLHISTSCFAPHNFLSTIYSMILSWIFLSDWLRKNTARLLIGLSNAHDVCECVCKKRWLSNVKEPTHALLKWFHQTHTNTHTKVFCIQGETFPHCHCLCLLCKCKLKNIIYTASQRLKR